VPTVRITVADQTITAQLADNPTARDLTDELPFTLTFQDFNRVEKVAELPRPLTTDGVPTGADPDINDIGYYAEPEPRLLLRRRRLLGRHRPHRKVHRPGHRADRAPARPLLRHHRSRLITPPDSVPPPTIRR
jgi:cyclophilin-like protein